MRYVFLSLLAFNVIILGCFIWTKRQDKTKKWIYLMCGCVALITILFGAMLGNMLVSRQSIETSGGERTIEDLSSVKDPAVKAQHLESDAMEETDLQEAVESQEAEVIKNNLASFFSGYASSLDIQLYVVYSGKYDVICNLENVSIAPESVLKDMAEFVVRNGYRSNIMSIIINVTGTNGKSNIVNVKDFSGETLPYVGFTLYKDGVVTTSTLTINKEILSKA